MGSSDDHHLRIIKQVGKLLTFPFRKQLYSQICTAAILQVAPGSLIDLQDPFRGLMEVKKKKKLLRSKRSTYRPTHFNVTVLKVHKSGLRSHTVTFKKFKKSVSRFWYHIKGGYNYLKIIFPFSVTRM